MEIKNDPNAPRGPGATRFNRILRLKPPEKLVEGQHMVYDHALRCYCARCKSLLNWDCPKDISYTEAECCGMQYRLQPRTVIVHVEDISDRPVLPTMKGSSYSDPNFAFAPDQVKGLPEPKTYVIRKKQKTSGSIRKCGICRKPGHTRRTCPDLSL